MANLLQRAFQPKRRHFLDHEPFTVDGNTYFGMARSLGGREEAPQGDFLTAVRGAYKRSGPVFACMLARQLVFSEARFQFRQMRGGRPGDLFGTEELSILEQPWPGGTTGGLLSRMMQDVDLSGNAFIANVNGQLRRLRPDHVTIVLGSRMDADQPGYALDAEVVGYIYHPNGMNALSEEGILSPENVAHYAPIPDPEFDFRGMSWLTPIIREVESDQAATRHKLQFFRNGATPQLVISLDSSVGQEQFSRFVEKMEAQHTGVDNAYKTLYMGGGATPTAVGKDLQQLEFKATQGAGETRIAAAAGVPPVIVGLSEGLQAATYSNYTQARRRFADGTLRPLWREAVGALSTLIDVPNGAELWYDTRDIPFLQEDRKDAAEIQASQAQTIRHLVDAGYQPETVIAAVESEDLALLQHSGLFSVQLQPPGSSQSAAEESPDEGNAEA